MPEGNYVQLFISAKGVGIQSSVPIGRIPEYASFLGAKAHHFG